MPSSLDAAAHAHARRPLRTERGFYPSLTARHVAEASQALPGLAFCFCEESNFPSTKNRMMKSDLADEMMESNPDRAGYKRVREPHPPPSRSPSPVGCHLVCRHEPTCDDALCPLKHPTTCFPGRRIESFQSARLVSIESCTLCRLSRGEEPSSTCVCIGFQPEPEPWS